MLQELLHFMPIKKTIADRKDNLTGFFFSFFQTALREPRNSTSKETSERRAGLNIHDYTRTRAFL